jgi:heavy metal sensor kinase
MNLPIRLRLTAWYFAAVLLMLSLFGAGMFVAMRWSIRKTTDEDLRLRVVNVETFMRNTLHKSTPDHFKHELQERIALQPGDDLLQIGNPDGGWLFRSEAMQQLGISSATGYGRTTPVVLTATIRSLPIRVIALSLVIDHVPYTIQMGASMQNAYAVNREFGWFLLASIPVMVVLASLGGYSMSRRVLAPVVKITDDARLIGAHNISQRLAVPAARDELQRLTLTLNEMMDRLESAFRRITEFTADASHELRTPTGVIRATAEFALMSSRNEDTYRAALRDNLEEADRMTLLIEDLLTLARADSGDRSQRHSLVNLGESLAQAFNRGRLLAEARQIQIDIDVPAQPLFIHGDSNALCRLFLIFIDNAVKYTPESGRITATLRADREGAVAEIQDTGIGIAADDVPHIFRRFYRADKARSRNIAGAGLGLSMAELIAKSHDAAIDVDSAPGRGSTFRVRFRSVSSPPVSETDSCREAQQDETSEINHDRFVSPGIS